MVSGLINANPTVYVKQERQKCQKSSDVGDEYAVESVDKLEIFDILFTSLSLFNDKRLFGLKDYNS